MTILWVSTKPPLPPTDGGRLLAHLSIQALRARQHRVMVVAPSTEDSNRDVQKAAIADGETQLIPVKSRSHTRTLVASLMRTVPFTIARHSHDAVQRAVGRVLAAESIDVVHAEQLQAVPQVESALANGIPVVLREQNVEAVLWDGLARAVSWSRPFASLEARRVRAFEGRTIDALAATIAVTQEDADALRGLTRAPERIHIVPPLFPAELPAASHALTGDPAVVVMGSQGWLPNEDGARWFVRTVWPVVARSLSGAALHLFGLAQSGAHGPRVTWHPPPRESADAFAPGAILAVPQRIGSGVRMKILEAWARGIPVVSTRPGVAGLEVHEDRNVMLADTPETFARAFTRLHAEPDLMQTLVTGGRATLRAHHDPTMIARRLEAVYASVLAARGGR